MSIEEQRKQKFLRFVVEAKAKGGPFENPELNKGWQIWNAALDSVVIELPNQLHAKPYACYEGGWNDALLETADLIEGMGLKVKP